MSGAIRRPQATAYDWLRQHAHARPQAAAVTEWREGAVVRTVTFAELLTLADRTAAALTERGARHGDRVVLLLPNALSFPATLLAAFAAGLIAVPAPPLAGSGTAAVHRLRGIAADCEARWVVTTQPWAQQTEGVLRETGPSFGAGQVPPATVHTWEDLSAPAPPGGPPLRRPPGPTADTVAFLQYTSGSTGRPKGAVITHRAVAAQCAQAARAYRERSEDTAVTWVPLSHDMGLVTGVLRPLHSGYASVLLASREFARSPLSWLTALSELRGTLSSAPDFAYGHCVRKIPAAAAASLDLSHWRVARDAGEVVRADTLDRFTAHFAPAGFRAHCLCPSYGMAEATLTVTTATPRRPARRLAVRRGALQAGNIRPVTGPHDAEGGKVTTLLSSGTPLDDTEVVVRDRDGRRLPDGHIGDVWIAGPQLFEGYWGRRAHPRDIRRLHQTGDRGFLHEGHLFVLGRVDDTVVHQGRNYYAADIADALADLPGLRPGRTAVFQTAGPPRSEPCGRSSATYGPQAVPAAHMCLVAERDHAAPTEERSTETARAARQRLAGVLGLFVKEVVLVPPGTLPVTTSGKVRVNETRRRYEAGLLGR
ncbi:AMP-binding protein [Streptomyces sp. NRRL B-24085]|uniref:AMP-binding protein n=1 Tax=Streptomyces sp. NRRL B-24085 TaxID=1709476 RepID=UPI000B1299D8|nr:AMP-binding protein [Streptomyces sp. NRRL B-24085]